MTSESAKVRPIEAPTIAMAFVMTRSRTLSEIIAVTAAEMAPRPLQGAAEHDETDLIGDGREKTPHGEDEKPDDDHGLAAPTVAGDTEGNLQKALRQTVNAEREPHEKLVVASGDLVSVNREDG